jgi:hypothetical protein
MTKSEDDVSFLDWFRRPRATQVMNAEKDQQEEERLQEAERRVDQLEQGDQEEIRRRYLRFLRDSLNDSD